jgi:hypothetical protein
MGFIDGSAFRVGETVQTAAAEAYRRGDIVAIFRSSGGYDLARVIYVNRVANQLVLRRMGLLERFWYYLRRPSLWKFALDIPFTPPDYAVDRYGNIVDRRYIPTQQGSAKTLAEWWQDGDNELYRRVGRAGRSA